MSQNCRDKQTHDGYINNNNNSRAAAAAVKTTSNSILIVNGCSNNVLTLVVIGRWQSKMVYCFWLSLLFLSLCLSPWVSWLLIGATKSKLFSTPFVALLINSVRFFLLRRLTINWRVCVIFLFRNNFHMNQTRRDNRLSIDYRVLKMKKI